MQDRSAGERWRPLAHALCATVKSRLEVQQYLNSGFI